MTYSNPLDPLRIFIEIKYDAQIVTEIAKQWENVKSSNSLKDESITIVYNGLDADSYYENDRSAVCKQNIVIYAKINKVKQDAIQWFNEFIIYLLDFNYEDINLGSNKLKFINGYPIESDINTVFEINLNIL
jgi:hypothetical protein